MNESEIESRIEQISKELRGFITMHRSEVLVSELKKLEALQIKKYNIAFLVGDAPGSSSKTFNAKSEAEAIKQFEDYSKRFDDGYYFLSIEEIQ